METKLDPYIEKILKQHLPDDIEPKAAVWVHKQSKQFIAKHRTLEIIAGTAGIVFDPPEIIQADAMEKICIIVATGRLGERVEWSFGEATPYNNRMSYPYAMAEKRAKDRVILKLIGIHGYIYSDIEMEDGKDDGLEPVKKTKAEIIKEAEENSAHQPDYHDIAANIEMKLQNCTNVDEVKNVWSQHTNDLKWMKESDMSIYQAVEVAKNVAKERVSAPQPATE